MAQIFPRWSNRIPLAIAASVPIAVAAITFFFWYWGSPKFTDVGYRPAQPVPFSHKLHAGEMGMDCRYCHNTVERGAMAAIPPTATCMNCHATGKVLPESPKLAALRTAVATETPVHWKRVHMLPDYAYFNHSAHLAAGVGCASCHGRIDQMPVVTQNQPLSMGWCLDCHRNPTPNLRPLDRITDMAWDQSDAKKSYDPASDPHRARKADTLQPPQHCSGCHR